MNSPGFPGVKLGQLPEKLRARTNLRAALRLCRFSPKNDRPTRMVIPSDGSLLKRVPGDVDWKPREISTCKIIELSGLKSTLAEKWETGGPESNVGGRDAL